MFISGANKRRLIQQSIVKELTGLLDPGSKPFELKKGRSGGNVVMFVGLQGTRRRVEDGLSHLTVSWLSLCTFFRFFSTNFILSLLFPFQGVVKRLLVPSLPTITKKRVGKWGWFALILSVLVHSTSSSKMRQKPR